MRFYFNVLKGDQKNRWRLCKVSGPSSIEFTRVLRFLFRLFQKYPAFWRNIWPPSTGPSGVWITTPIPCSIPQKVKILLYLAVAKLKAWQGQRALACAATCSVQTCNLNLLAHLSRCCLHLTRRDCARMNPGGIMTHALQVLASWKH